MAKENKTTAKKTTTASKKRRNIVVGTVNILATFNNTIVSISDTQGNVIAWSSSGKMGFKGSRKSTPYAAQMVASNAVEKAKEYGFQTANVIIRGAGVGRESALRALQSNDVAVLSITDDTYYPHNGWKKKKRRRN